MKKDIRVLIVGSDSSVKGGITSVIDRFLNYNWDGISVELLATYIEGSELKKILFFLKSIFKYIWKLIKSDFDIAHIHMSYKGSFFRKFIIVKLGKLFNKKMILHLHGSEFEVFYKNSNKVVKKLIINIFENCDLVIVLGESWGKVVKGIAPNSNISIFNNAVNIPDYTVKWNKEKINLLFLGVLIKRKGIYDLIECIKILNEEDILRKRNLNFIIGGTGEEEETVKQMVKEYNLNKYVEMVGWVTGNMKEELFKKSQIFILPSYNEGLPMAILEAMSYGIPVIATNVGSVDEAVKNNVNGFCVEAGDIYSLRKSIEKIIFSGDKYKKYSEKSKEISKEKFNEKKYMDNIREVYLKLLNIN